MREANVAPSTLKLSSGTDGNCSCLLAHWIQAATSAALQRRGSAIQSNRFEFNRLFHTFIYLFTSSPIYIWKSFDVINYFEDSYYLAIPNICIRKIQFVRINDTLYVSFFFIDALIQISRSIHSITFDFTVSNFLRDAYSTLPIFPFPIWKRD